MLNKLGAVHMAADVLTIPTLFNEAAARNYDKVALQAKKDNQWLRLTYGDLETASLKVAYFLIREGLKKGDAAGIVLENRPEWLIIYLGMMYAGLACVPLDPQLGVSDLRGFILNSQARIVFTSRTLFDEKFKPFLERDALRFVILDYAGSKEPNALDFAELENSPSGALALPQVLAQDIASLIYTSGTTAQPKAVLLSHGNICSNFKSIAKLNICFPSDNILSILPLYHAYSFMVTLMVPVLLGAKATFALSFKPKDLSQIIREAKVTILPGVPQLFSLLHKAILEKIKNIPSILLPLGVAFIRPSLRSRLGRDLRLLVSGGARLEPKIARDLTRILGVKLVEGYGLTETSPVVTLNPVEKIKFGSVGKPIPGVQISILNPDKSGIGQVLIKGPNVMEGYFKQPQLTAEAVKDGWFYSGDAGYIDKEGYLFLSGREKDIIVLSSGKNVYPEELEHHYAKSPYIKEICVLGRQIERFGRTAESLYAVVVPDLEYFNQQKEMDIRGRIVWELENLGKGLPSYLHIMGFTLAREELPRTALKKIKRYQVKEKYREEKSCEQDILKKELSAQDQAILSHDIARRIIKYISRQVGRQVHLWSHLEIDLGIDSLGRVEMAAALEQLLRIKIPDELIYSVSTVRELISGIIDKTHPACAGAGAVEPGWSRILRGPPSQALLGKIRIEATFLDMVLTYIFKALISFALRLLWLLRIQGRGNLPLRGPCLICPNHASFLDGFVIFSALRLSSAAETYFLGYSRILEHPLIRWAIKPGRLITIDPNIYFTEALQAVSLLLSRGKIVCIFPEGRRSIDENVAEFKRGAAILIKELDVAVIPAYIKGSHQSWPRGNLFPRLWPIKVSFGQRVSARELAKEGVLEDYEAIAASLREEVLKLAC